MKLHGLEGAACRLAFFAVAAWTGSGLAADEAATPQAVDFDREIRPIFEKRCLECHGAVRRSGGLRLDSKVYAEERGDSRRPILGGDLESNEVYRRVNSQDAGGRMPKGAAMLPDSELEALRRWVLAGTPWPDSPSAPPTPTWLDRFDVFILKHREEAAIFQPYGFAVMLVLIAAWFRERAERRVANVPTAHWFLKRIAATRTGYYAVLALFLSLAGGVSIVRHREANLNQQIDGLRQEVARLSPQTVTAVYGDPPRPIRPGHPKQIAGVYYRGNCERSPALFNGGNYLTATFRLHLCDARQQILQLGDRVPKEGLFLRLEIERAPRTTDSLFSPEIMSSLFLSKEVFTQGGAAANEPLLRFEPLTKNWKWAASFPLGRPQGETGTLSGLVYFYKGVAESNYVRGEVHYGIQYDLLVKDGRIAEGSDLWMGSLYWTMALALPQPGKVPLEEWFDWRPIPAISGPNSSDPVLLGIPPELRGPKPQDSLKTPQ